MTIDRFLVTGALGCIGSWAVRQLTEEGSEVVVADVGTGRERFDLVTQDVDTTGVVFERVDITALDEVRDVLDRHAITRVIHLAALQVPFCRADPPHGALVNVVGTANVFEAVKERSDRIRNVVYAGSVGMFDAADADPDTMVVGADATPHPRSHYGVYKQANEGTAYVYWEESGVASVGLRPFVVYGPGRDQGLTSSPTMALLAASVGRPYRISYGGRVQMQFAPDAAATFVAASRHHEKGAVTANLGGPVVTMPELIGHIERAEPAAAGTITYASDLLPFPESVDSSAVRTMFGDLPATSIEDGVARTLGHFRAASRAGTLPDSLLGRLGS